MKNHNDFIIKIFATESKEERYQLLKDYMLSLNFDELMAWTKSNFAQLNASLDKGLSKEEREKLLAQLTKFDDFQAVYALQKKLLNEMFKILRGVLPQLSESYRSTLERFQIFSFLLCFNILLIKTQLLESNY